MVAVFSGFMFGQEPLAKMIRLGLATAIAINATHRPSGPGPRHDDAAAQGELMAAGLARSSATGWPSQAQTANAQVSLSRALD